MTNEEAIERLKAGAPFSEIYCEKYEEAISLAIKALEERPKGEWEYTDGRWGLGDWRCSKCGGYSNEDTHYCPNCGADMKGDET